MIISFALENVFDQASLIAILTGNLHLNLLKAGRGLLLLGLTYWFATLDRWLSLNKLPNWGRMN